MKLFRKCEMRSYDQLEAEMEAIQEQMVEAMKHTSASALGEGEHFSKEFCFTAGVLNDSLAERNKK